VYPTNLAVLVGAWKPYVDVRMDDINYVEADGSAILTTADDNEWIRSDNVVSLDDWI
jgi:hypothetical protein